MFEDAKKISQGSELECDVVIIGSGAAGIPCACELIDSGLSVIILESGGESMDSATQELAKGTVTNPSEHGDLDQYRKRVYGGTTTVWGGRCAPFDEIDFEKRDYIKFSGWPISKSDLDPYYSRAHEYLFIGNYDYDCASSLSDGCKPTIPGLSGNVWKQDKLWRFSLPADLGKEYKEKLLAAENVRTLLNANVLKLNTEKAGDKIESVEVASLEKNNFTVKAKKVIVAAGGLEATRLLLLSDNLGNEHDQVGRYYGSHLSGDLGEVSFTAKSEPVIWQYQQTKEGIYAKRQLRPSEDAQRDKKLMNFRCILTHPPFADASHKNGVLSAAYLAKRFFKGQIPPEYSKEMAASGYHDVSKHIRNAVFGCFGVLRFGIHWTFRRILARRKYPSISLRSRANAYTIHFDSEQAPNPESRVKLGTDLDVFGLPKLSVDWQYLDQDVDSVVTWMKNLRQELKDSGVGEFRQSEQESVDLILKGFSVGSHHIGTTRMSKSPEDGVVDENCEVHSVRGLYILGPSTFCTGSFANPVLTTVAMSIRLASHIKSEQV